jgi:hypothetical protein
VGEVTAMWIPPPQSATSRCVKQVCRDGDATVPASECASSSMAKPLMSTMTTSSVVTPENSLVHTTRRAVVAFRKLRPYSPTNCRWPSRASMSTSPPLPMMRVTAEPWSPRMVVEPFTCSGKTSPVAAV